MLEAEDSVLEIGDEDWVLKTADDDVETDDEDDLETEDDSAFDDEDDCVLDFEGLDSSADELIVGVGVLDLVELVFEVDELVFDADKLFDVDELLFDADVFKVDDRTEDEAASHKPYPA